MSKLWQKTDEILHAEIEQFEVGDDYLHDLALAPYDVYGSAVHAQMLSKINILTLSDNQAIKSGFKEILGTIKDEKLTIFV